MKTQKKHIESFLLSIFFIFFYFGNTMNAQKKESYEIQSPDNSIKIVITVDGKIQYSVLVAGLAFLTLCVLQVSLSLHCAVCRDRLLYTVRVAGLAFLTLCGLQGSLSLHCVGCRSRFPYTVWVAGLAFPTLCGLQGSLSIHCVGCKSRFPYTV